MSEDLSRKRLGRGLAALIGEIDRPAAAEKPAANADGKVPIEFLSPNPKNPRRHFGDADLTDLAQSIREHGVVQPVVARPSPTQAGRYEIIAGERRWRAAQKAQLHEVPVVIRTLDDLDALQLALVENLQRADLSPVDEAQGYRRLMADFNQTHEEIAHTMGRSRPHIVNTLRLLDLPESIRDMIRGGEITAGHGRQLLTFPDPEAMAARVVSEKLSVRDLEKLAAGERLKKAGGGGKKQAAPSGSKSADTKALEKRVEEALGLKASLTEGKGERTTLTLEIETYDQLDTVVERLTRR
jgi:ParB family chromosome partitioning protein